MHRITSVEETARYKISTRLLMQAALKKGYELYYYPSSPSTQSGITHCVKGNRELFFKSTCSALTPAFGVFAAENKALTYSLLVSNAIPTPESVCLSYEASAEEARYMLEKYKQVVVKPAAANHGDGVSVGVQNMTELNRAMQLAHTAAGDRADIIIQQQIEGSEYRFLVVSGKVIAVASRKPPYVIGNGKATIQVLLERKNADPRRGEGHLNPLTFIDIEKVREYKGDTFLSSVPAAGQRVEVLGTSNLSQGGEAEDFTETASPALKNMAVRAARSCFLGIAGVDIMTKNIHANNVDDSYVIEVNLTPGIRMHHYPVVGMPRDVATPIFAEIEKNSRLKSKFA